MQLHPISGGDEFAVAGRAGATDWHTGICSTR